MRFMIECMARDIVIFIMKDYKLTQAEAMDLLYTSKTFKILENPESGLYYQSSLYVYDFLQEEMQGMKRG